MMKSLEASVDEVKVRRVPPIPNELCSKVDKLFKRKLPFSIQTDNKWGPVLAYQQFPTKLNQDVLRL